MKEARLQPISSNGICVPEFGCVLSKVNDKPTSLPLGEELQTTN